MLSRANKNRRNQLDPAFGKVELVRCEEGILVKPLPRMPVQAALAKKLAMNRPTHLDLADIDIDDLGW